jgi:hypothetical protein
MKIENQLMTKKVIPGTCGANGDNLTWSLDTGSGVLTISGSGAMADYYDVGGAPWYSHRSKIKTVMIGNGVTSIGDYAFFGCTSLTGIAIPNSVISIGNQAFSRCSGLTGVTIGVGVTSIGNAAFSYCSGLTSVIIGNGVTSIEHAVFFGCRGLTSITIPNSVTSIGERVFDGTPWYDNQPDGVIYINKMLYKYKGTMQGNTSITVQEGTKVINVSAFSGCSGLTSIAIPNSVTSIGSSAFRGCSGLTSITIPNSVTSIGSLAFQDCTSLTGVTLGKSVTSIGRFAFFGCRVLTSITIPNSVTSIGNSAFAGCHGLTGFAVSEGNARYAATDGVLFSKDGDTLIAYPNAKAATYVIPDGVTCIGVRAFSDCSGLTSVTLPNSVTSIGIYAFNGCRGLREIHSLNPASPIVGATTFDGVPKASCRVYVPSGAIAAYQAANGWKEFANILEEERE